MSAQGQTSILDAMRERPIIGDGGYVFALERRGYVKAGSFTVEAVLENPQAVEQLHRDFVYAGCDVLQALTFYASGGRLQFAESSKTYETADLNQKACDIVNDVGRPSGIFLCGGLSPTQCFSDHVRNGGKCDKQQVQNEFKNQLDIFTRNGLDFVLGEFFDHIEEVEWCIESMKSTAKPVACTMRIGPRGDRNGTPPGECAVRMARAGADIVGINCQYDYRTALKTIRLMKEALDECGLQPFLMLQALGYRCPEAEDCMDGYFTLPEYPFALEPRLLTRWEARMYAREAYDLGVRYIGGCCGFEPYHIREMAEELAAERGKVPPGHGKWENYGTNVRESMFKYVHKRVGKDYWLNLKPASGRPEHPTESTPATKD